MYSCTIACLRVPIEHIHIRIIMTNATFTSISLLACFFPRVRMFPLEQGLFTLKTPRNAAVEIIFMMSITWLIQHYIHNEKSLLFFSHSPARRPSVFERFKSACFLRIWVF